MKVKPKVNINILTFNGAKYLRPCLDSALNQDYTNFNILIIDNASTDKTIQIINEYLKKDEKKKRITFIQNKENVGFSEGHNQGIDLMDGEYVMLLNQDAVLEPNFLIEAIKVLEKDEKIAALQPKVLKYDFEKKEPKNLFDTTGLLILKNRRIINRGQGKKDTGQFDRKEEIFGADGAVPVYRRSALKDIKLPVLTSRLIVHNKQQKFEYFDSSFFAYKEDVDLAWRLKLYGWRAIYVPEVLAYHERGAGESASRKSLDIIRERKKISSFAKTISFKNQRLMQIKNETLGLYIKHFHKIIWKEIRSWGYVILIEPRILKIIPEMVAQMPKALRQRKVIQKRKLIRNKDLKKWFF
jgi:GT2 family glycosyltransferase